MSVIAVIDILLVAVIIYELLALIKGTRAAYMLVGVAVLALALYFSSVGELATLNWLMGALMVIEREIGLRTYVESGVPLDARLSYDLLATIFRPSAPLHDGAVIVQKDRIAAAACFLPLSMNPVLSTQLGTRHRAAIGITEETDAVAVIISEETGTISMAVAGSIERELTVERLRERLSHLLRRYAPAPSLPSPVEESFIEEEPPSSHPSRRQDAGLRP